MVIRYQYIVGMMALCIWFGTGCATVMTTETDKMYPLAKFQSKQQLKALYAEKRTTLVIINHHIYQPGAKCLLARTGGSAIQQRQKNEMASARLSGEAATERQQVEQAEARLKGEAATVRQSNEMAEVRLSSETFTERQQAEQAEARLKGEAATTRQKNEQTETRRSGEAFTERQQAEQAEARLKGEAATARQKNERAEARLQGEQSTQDHKATQRMNYTCQCKKVKQKTGFQIHGMAKNTRVQQYDGRLRIVEKGFVQF